MPGGKRRFNDNILTGKQTGKDAALHAEKLKNNRLNALIGRV